MRITAFIITVLVCLACQGQKFFISLSGIVTDHYSAQPMSDVVVHLETSHRISDVVTKRDGMYRFTLDRGSFYSVEYRKAGYITKRISIDATHVPEVPDVPYYDMDVQMTLFEIIPDFDFSFFDEPLGEAQYKQSVRTVNWDNKFSDDKRRKLTSIMNEYNKTYRGYYARMGTRPIVSDSILVLVSDSVKNATIANDILAEFQPLDTLVQYYDDSAAPAKQVETTVGLFFTVQVGVYSSPTALDQLFNISPLNSELMDDGRIRYTSGMFDSIDEAIEYRKKMVNNGVQDAFVVSYFNGQKMPLEDAIYLLAKFGNKVSAH